ncbi:MAG: hypothetical protein QM775_25675 [Pirellulales bacterium]
MDDFVMRLRRRLDELGISARKASVAAGLGEHFLSGLLSGRKSSEGIRRENLESIEAVLGTLTPRKPVASRVQREAFFEVPVHISDFDIIGDQIDRISSWLTLTRHSHTHFMSNEMRNWLVRRNCRSMGHDDDWIDQYLAAKGPRNQESLLNDEYGHHFVHKHLMSDDVFRSVPRDRSGWLLEVASTVCRSGNQTQLAIATKEAWKTIHSRIGRATGYWTYCTIEVIDESFAMIRPTCAGPQYVTTEAARIRVLRDAIESAFPVVDHRNIHTKQFLDALARRVQKSQQ